MVIMARGRVLQKLKKGKEADVPRERSRLIYGHNDTLRSVTNENSKREDSKASCPVPRAGYSRH